MPTSSRTRFGPKALPAALLPFAVTINRFGLSFTTIVRAHNRYEAKDLASKLEARFQKTLHGFKRKNG